MRLLGKAAALLVVAGLGLVAGQLEDDPMWRKDVSELGCLNRCSGNGVCVNDICHCTHGFGGISCEEETCPYPCKNGGSCVAQKCLCPPGFSGIDCGLLDCPTECSQRGICNNGVCQCLDGFEGPACEYVRHECPNNCSWAQRQGECVGGACFCRMGWAGEGCMTRVCTLSCSGHGTCHLLAFNRSRCVCDDGWGGLNCARKVCPKSCSGHGECSEEGVCHCLYGWKGDACDEPACHPTCGIHGTCKAVVGMSAPRCMCDEGWDGITCNMRSCPNNCNQRGSCSPITGACECPPEYSGVDCSLSKVGQKHMRGCQTRAHCSDHGLCLNSHCKCNKGYFGDLCQHKFEDPFMYCPNGCSGHGLCNYQAKCMCVFPHGGPDCSDVECVEECSDVQRCVYGSCVCEDPSLTGPTCSRQTCPKACSHHGKCYTNNGTCACDPGYAGEACDLHICPNDCTGSHGICLPSLECLCRPGWTGDDCSHIECPEGCNGRGVCVENGKCSCNQMWWGDACENKQCEDPTCSQRGMCVNGTCHCNVGFHGERCEAMGCPRNCNHPVGGVCGPDLTCQCKKGYHGPDCMLTMPLEQSCPSQCSGHGHCFSQRCACAAGWTGDACNISLCQERCYEAEGRGVCNASGICECVAGYGGLYCQLNLCSDRCAPPNGHCNFTKGVCDCAPGFAGEDCGIDDPDSLHGCLGHGIIVRNTSCLCDDGWSGWICSEKRCPNDCSGNGQCANGTCMCDNGFDGVDCSYGSATTTYKQNCNERCAQSCVPRCKHVHGRAGTYGKYGGYIDEHTGLLDGPKECPNCQEQVGKESGFTVNGLGVSKSGKGLAASTTALQSEGQHRPSDTGTEGALHYAQAVLQSNDAMQAAKGGSRAAGLDSIRDMAQLDVPQ